MSFLERIGSWFGGEIHKVEPPTVLPRPRASIAPREPINDAQAYGVAIVRATVPPGTWYWQAVRVHHLTPEENGGNHHIFLDLFDPLTATEANPLGGRVFGARVRVMWDGGEQVVTVEKPLNEPGANFPMWKWQVCSVEVLGMPGEALPSDRVIGMHTGHPDEAVGNTLFHHSFSVTFLKVRTPDAIHSDSVIYGVIHQAAGRTASLVKDGTTVASQVIGANETFRFTDLGAGEYTVVVEGTQLRSDPIYLNGQDQSQLELTLIVAESSIAGCVHNGAGRTLSLTREGIEVATQVVADDKSYRFTGLTAGTHRVVVAGTRLVSPAVTLDGTNAVTLDLVAPAANKSLAHYVLFGPPDHPATKARLLLAQDYLLTFGPSFGFSLQEASNAGLVTIIAGTDTISAQAEADLGADGTPVQRIAGSASEVAAALAERIAGGRPF